MSDARLAAKRPSSASMWPPTRSRPTRRRPTAPRVGLDDDRRRPASRRAAQRGVGYTYARRGGGDADRPRSSRAIVAGPTRWPRRRVWAAMVPRGPQPRPPGHRLDGDLGGRRGALGSQGAPARTSARRPCSAGAATAVPLYGSGGFTSLLATSSSPAQLGGWVEAGIPRVKMKVGRDPEADPERVAPARGAIGPDAELFVDANGAYRRKQALRQAERLRRAAACSWFEEPVSSDDLDGPAAPARPGAAGHGRSPPASTATTPPTSAGCWRREPSTCCRPTSPAAAASPGCCAAAALCRRATRCRSRRTARRSSTPIPLLRARPRCVHLEYFHDHVRIERLLFDGAAGAARRLPDPRSRAARQRPRAQDGGRRAVRRLSSDATKEENDEREPNTGTSPSRSPGRRRPRSAAGPGGRCCAGALEPSARPRAADARRRHDRGGGAARRRDLRQPLRRLVRQQVDVDAGRALAGARRGGGRRGPLRAGGAHGCRVLRRSAAGRARRRLHPRARACRKPGRLRRALYNLVMGPPLLAPGSLSLVGGIGLVAAVVRRER